MQVHIEDAFRGHCGGLEDAGVELICGELFGAVVDEHAVVLVGAPGKTVSRVAPGLDFITVGDMFLYSRGSCRSILISQAPVWLLCSFPFRTSKIAATTHERTPM